MRNGVSHRRRSLGSREIPKRAGDGFAGRIQSLEMAKITTTHFRDLVWRMKTGLWRSPEVATLKRIFASSVARRFHSPVDGWIQLDSDYGIPFKGNVVTLGDMTVAQLNRHAPGIPARSIQHWRREQARVYEAARACCVASNWARSSIIDDYGISAEKVHVVGFGRSLEVPPATRSWSSPKFLFVGLGWDRKNGAAVLHAFTEIARRHRDARLDIVGPDCRFDLPGVFSHGPLGRAPAERDRLRHLYQSATCFVLPSWLEPFGIVYAEAAAAGLPVIGTSVGGADEVIAPGTGCLVHPSDRRGLFAAMERFTDPVLARNAGVAAQRHAALFTWPLVASRLLRALCLAPLGHELSDFLDRDSSSPSTGRALDARV